MQSRLAAANLASRANAADRDQRAAAQIAPTTTLVPPWHRAAQPDIARGQGEFVKLGAWS
jgi:hypothetical protein